MYRRYIPELYWIYLANQSTINLTNAHDNDTRIFLLADINNLFLFLLLFGVCYAPVIKDAPVMTDRDLF